MKKKAIINGRIVLPDSVLEGYALVFDETIHRILPDGNPKELGCDVIIDAGGAYVTPGLIDVHIHGCIGKDTSDGQPEDIRQMSEALAANGVTAWLPTTMTLPVERLHPLFENLRAAVRASAEADWMGAEVLGVNMEGPYISPVRRGAHREDYIQKPDAAFVKQYADIIRLVTIAPEVEGGMEFIREITRDTEVICSIGHTDADYAQAVEAMQAGCTHATHLFNAMTGLHHRKPGVVGAALTQPEVYTELICDTFHIHPGLFALVARMKGDKLVLITDCMRAGGLPDGEFDLGGQKVTVSGIHCLLPDGTIAGSVLKLNQGAANLKRHTDLTMPEVLRTVSLNPAASIGAAGRKGSLEVGKDADIVLMDENFQIIATYGKGRKIYDGKL